SHFNYSPKQRVLHFFIQCCALSETKGMNYNYGENTYAIEDILVKALQNYLKGEDVDSVLETAQKEAENQLK
ncbi:hypothetical protein HO995_09275, partial [Streptococcus suis]|nr:hypothetical protein [Streptococcus suis]